MNWYPERVRGRKSIRDSATLRRDALGSRVKRKDDNGGVEPESLDVNNRGGEPPERKSNGACTELHPDLNDSSIYYLEPSPSESFEN